MSDDKFISQLITQSLRRELDPEESARVARHLGENKEAAKFAKISQLIQNSVSSIAKSGPFNEPGLSQDAKDRLKKSVIGAVEEKLSLSQTGLIGNAVTQSPHSDETRFEGSLTDEQQRRVLSRFRLIRRLGQGGLGNVWLAKDEKLNRNVAIKELRAEALESEKSWRRFHREAEITGHLEHPNVVPLYQYGVDRTTGEPFYAMRFVGKRTLANAIEEYHDRLEAGESDPLALHRLLSIFLDICQAIAYAHSRGVIHRDLKPENVALDNFGQVIVLDWGLAKVLEDSELGTKMINSGIPNESTLAQTMHGDVVGTPLYMSPEQASGDLDQVDDKTDVYGLGAILFSILTGQPPHTKSATEASPNVEAVLKAISESEIPKPSDYGKCVPSELEAICKKAMARKRHLRFTSVQELADAVESWIAGQSGKQTAYETMRMEGRELRTDLQSSVFNLERNVRFAASLPPIEQLINAKTEEDISVWRERLTSIFQGLIRANPDYLSIGYCAVETTEGDNQFREIVRVERHSSDATSIRAVPKSRLHTSQVNNYVETVIHKKPDEVHTSLVCDPKCNLGNDCPEAVGLLASVPVYNSQTEEVFGFVIINCDMEQMLRTQMNRRFTAGEIVVACDIFNIMMHNKSGQIVEESMTQEVAGKAPHFLPAIEALQTQTDFIDETNADIYGARLWFIPNEHGIMYLLKRDKS